MKRSDVEPSWRALSEEVISGLVDWRNQHPRATLKEIETALDERLDRLRARLLEDTALASERADWSGVSATERPQCPDCGQGVHSAGQRVRRLQTHGHQELTLTRRYGVCPTCGRGFFPPR